MNRYILGAIAATFLLTGCVNDADRSNIAQAKQLAQEAKDQAAAAAASAAAAKTQADKAAEDAALAADTAKAASEKSSRIFEHGSDK